MDLLGSMETHELAELVLEQWARAHGPRFQLRRCELHWNFSEQDLLNYRTTLLAGVPVIFAEASSVGLRAGLPAQSLWISLWGEIAKGTDASFVQSALEFARSRGKAKLVFGADEFHFTPGIPLNSEAGQRLAAAVKAAGFASAEDSDFVGPAKSSAVDSYIREATESEGLRDFHLVPADTPERMNQLEKFLESEFPGRWTREFRFWRARTDTRRAFWMSLVRVRQDESPNALVGFARIAVRNRQQPLDAGWAPGALRLPLLQPSFESQAEWRAYDGCLGPIGVANSLRGQGVGKALLGRVLQTLQVNLAERICIDWTNALKYYEPLHFERTRDFLTAWKSDLL